MDEPEKRVCPGCVKEPPQSYINYCDWDCNVVAAKAAGGRTHTPNGLPVRCVKADGTMLEHEHGDHPDYMFPVEIRYVGPVGPDQISDAEMTFGGPCTEAEARDMMSETHALIYSDSYVAITLYECSYAMWYLMDGEFAGGNLWKSGKWKLDEESRQKILMTGRVPT